MSFEPREYLRHILVEVDYLLETCAGLGLEEFKSNETLRRAAVRSLEIIGELQRKFQKSFERSIRPSSGVRCPV